MGMQNTCNPLRNPYFDRRNEFFGLEECGTHTMLIDKLIGNSYEVVKYVAMHMDIIRHVSANMQMLYNLSMAGTIESVVVGPIITFDLTSSPIIEVDLTENVTETLLTNVSITSPALILVRIKQDSVGGHTFVWPTNFLSHGDIDLTANAISQQFFARNTDLTYDISSPMMFPRG